MHTAPIALFLYNRRSHAQQTVDALKRNRLAEASNLFIFCDGAKSKEPAELARMDEVRAYARTVNGFKSVDVHERAVNFGLAGSIIEGVSRLCDEYGRVIVVEDDLVTSPWFLDYMNRALDLYEHEERVASIHGYCYPTRTTLPETFFLRGADCWGWATWSRAWKFFQQDGARLLEELTERGLKHEFNLDGAYDFTQMLRDQIVGKNDSWAVRWHATCFLLDKLTLYPGRSLVHNIGNDASGTHGGRTVEFAADLADSPIALGHTGIAPSEQARRAFAEFLRAAHKRSFKGLLARAAARVRKAI